MESPAPSTPSTDLGSSPTLVPDALLSLLDQTKIPYYSTTSDLYPEVAETYVANWLSPPLIVRPRDEEEVSIVLARLANAAPQVDVTVRSGGHDLSARTFSPSAICLDVRDLSHVCLSQDRKTVKIGGGISTAQLLEELESEGLITAVGAVGTVGWVGWAMFGGYGSLSGMAGMGCDQIVGARVVDWKGEAKELTGDELRLFRGGGIGWGVVTEVEVRVWEGGEIQAGIFAFPPDLPFSLSQTITKFFTKFRAFLDSNQLPPELCLQPAVLPTEGEGKVFVLNYVYHGPAALSTPWVGRLCSLSPTCIAMVEPTTLTQVMSKNTDMLPAKVYGGRTQNVLLRGLCPSQQAVDVISRYAETMPAGGMFVGMHIAHGAANNSWPSSIFRPREPHIMVHIVGLSITDDPLAGNRGTEWANAFAAELRGCEGALEVGYFPLLPGDEADADVIWGQEAAEMIWKTRRERDPMEVFKGALPQIR